MGKPVAAAEQAGCARVAASGILPWGLLQAKSANRERHGKVRKIGLCVAMMLAVFTTMAASTIVNVAIPSMMVEFGATAASAQFVLTAFLAAMIVTMPTVAWLTVRWGVRTVTAAALLLFAFASGLAAASDGLAMVVASRCLQGGAAGVIQPCVLLALYLAFPPDRRGTAVGLHALAVAVAPSVGPWLGGLVVEVYGWRELFAAAIPIAMLSAGLAAIFIPRQQVVDDHIVRLDKAGSTRLLLAFTLLFSGGWEVTRTGASKKFAYALLFGGVAVTFLFFRHQLAAKSPLINLKLLAEPSFRAACLIAVLLGAGLYGSTLMVPLFAQLVQGLSPGQSGLLLLPAGFVLIAVSPLAGRLGNRYPLAPLLGLGLGVFAASNLLLLGADQQTGFFILAVALALGRAGLGLASPLTNLAALRVFGDERAAEAAALISFARQLGAIGGVVGLSLILSAASPAHGKAPDPATTLQAFHGAFAAAAALLLAGLWAVRAYALNAGAQRHSTDQGLSFAQAVEEIPFEPAPILADASSESPSPVSKSG